MSVPTNAQFWSKEDPSKPDAAFLKNHFYREGRLTEEQALIILEKATEILKNEPNVLDVDAPITGESGDCLQFATWAHYLRLQSVETFMGNTCVFFFLEESLANASSCPV